MLNGGAAPLGALAQTACPGKQGSSVPGSINAKCITSDVVPRQLYRTKLISRGMIPVNSRYEGSSTRT